MDVKLIGMVDRRLKRFLKLFEDCFNRSEPRSHLETYVNGQVSTLKRKSVEPMALKSGTPPRTLQRFLESVRWNEQRLRDRIQWIVAREHADPNAIGLIDESGYPKDGRHTACADHQWCGNTGKLDNCVVVVHTGYVADDFHCILDSELFMPKSWAEDLPRRRAAYIPDDVKFRKKTEIALGQVARALDNGLRVAAWTFDEFYGRDSKFLDALQSMGQNYIGEVPCDFSGWLEEPRVLLRPTPQEMRKPGPRRKFPRIARKALPVSEVRNLVKYSPVLRNQPWHQYRIKDGEKGPVVWEVKHAEFYRKKHDGQPSQAHHLIVARNVQDPKEIKYFMSNMVPSTPGITLNWLLWVGFSRHPIEQCFREGKDELGMDHFEVRGWRSIHRHLHISQLSHLFCARVRQELQTKKNDRKRIPHGRDGTGGRVGGGGGARIAAVSPTDNLQTNGGEDRLLPQAQPTNPQVSYKDGSAAPQRHGDRRRPIALLRPARLIVRSQSDD